MATVTVGTRLTANALLNDTEFENTDIFIHQCNADGVVGFVVNKLFDRSLHELVAYSNSKPIALYDGGPVDRAHLFVLHCQPELVSGSTHITDNIYFGGDFAQIVRLLNNGQLPTNDVRIFIGYCGWDNDQLQEEIEEGSWQVSVMDSDQLFHAGL